MQSLDVSQRSVWWFKHGQPCLHQLHMLTGHSLPLVYGMCIYPHSPPPLPFHWLISVTGACFHCCGGSWLEGAGLPAMGNVTRSSGWLCQKWKPLDIPCTHFHLETRVVNFSVTDTPLIQDIVALTFITDTGPHAVSCFTWPFSAHKETVSLGLEKPL